MMLALRVARPLSLQRCMRRAMWPISFTQLAGSASRNQLRGISMAPARSTLGPDANNPTTIEQPVRDRTGQILRVSVTSSAAEKLHAIAAEDARPNLVLRIRVESGGCHGFQYVFQLQNAQEITKDDSIFQRDGSRVIIDHRSLRVLRDATVDYSTELIGSQFRVTSPHTSSACGCGSSFSLDEEP